MSEKEIEAYLENLEIGLAEAEKKMLQEKAVRGESVVYTDSNNNVVHIPASEVIKKYPQFQ